MKHIITLLAVMPLAILAQTNPLKGVYGNAEYDVYLKIDLLGTGIDVPGREMFGPLPGYLGKGRYTFYWLITSAQPNVDKGNTLLWLINDYGSEDLEATISIENDTTLLLKQGKGSTIKMPHNGKWQKLPKTLRLIRTGDL